ncbi:quinolinate synthase NadA [Candidatus Methanodesulfokora washburnensis]|uniref:Quinolinate synthase n=1 Tax=Candidatus Methanodesulfokora washburnensis TaxID=2478471 RepID=A0A429GGI9_9CREN|nr:quinolinate synthase NadA [Candidatus Methanodesulfokores washburnensis]RSN72875.1 quinolinate synthase NadA [Candidatus Methanodesulfokores washburnensis]
MQARSLIDETLRLKRERKAIILAHNYQAPEIQDVADFVGDSLELSIKAMEADAKLIVFCGVDFMAEQAAVINESAEVLHPDPSARCPMAAMIGIDDVRKARKLFPKAPVVIYVNSPAVVKAEADYVVTSANAADVVKAIESDVVIFGPDRHLTEHVAEKTGKIVIPVPPNSHCPVHVMFKAEEIKVLKPLYSDAVLIAHPECPAEVRSLASFVGSTSQMVGFVNSCGYKRVIVGTEVGIIHRLAKENPDKVFIPASTSAICIDMKKITLEKVYTSLRNRVYRVEVPKKIAEKVKRAIENSFRVLGREPSWSKR